MPSVRLFGRRWAIGSDDFVFPGVAEGMLRAGWFAIMLVLYTVVFPDGVDGSPCANGSNLTVYILCLLALNSVLVAVSFATALVSARGTILNAHPRRSIYILLYIRFPLFFIEVAINVYGTVAIAQPIPGCAAKVLNTIVAIIVLQWIVIVAFVVGLFVIFDPLGSLHPHEHSIAREHAKRLWQRRLRVICLCANADDNAKSAFEDVADLISEFFYDIDLVPTDVWADEFTRPEWMNVTDAARMIQFALGVYGWPYYVWNKSGCEPWAALFNQTRCCQRCACDQVLIVRDNCCMCNTAAFLVTTHIARSDLFYASFHNQIFETPFIACADRDTNTIVVAIRGSLSLHDALTDLTVLDEDLPIDGDDSVLNADDVINQAPVSARNTASSDTSAGGNVNNKSIRVHRGMLHSARYVCQQIDKQNILNDMFVLYPNFQLVITGHSLGAGVAVVVALLLRSRYPALRCFAFSPPGCIVCKNGVRLTRKFVCSVIVGDDFVPRASFHSMQTLKENIVEAIEQCTSAKYQILIKGCFKLFCGTSTDHDRLDNTRADLEAPPPDSHRARSLSDDEDDRVVIVNDNQSTVTSGRALLRGITSRHNSYGGIDELDVKYLQLIVHTRHTLRTQATAPAVGGARASLAEAVRRRPHSSVLLHCPGQLMHLVTPSRSSARTHHDDDDAPVHVQWGDYRQLATIKMSSRMIADHIPNHVAKVLAKAAEDRAAFPHGRTNTAASVDND